MSRKKEKVKLSRIKRLIRGTSTISLAGEKLLATNKKLKVGKTFGLDSPQIWTQSLKQLKVKTRDSTNFSQGSVIIESQINTTNPEVIMMKIEKKPSSGRRTLQRNDMRTIRDAGLEVSGTTIVMTLLNWVGKVTGLTMT